MWQNKATGHNGQHYLNTKYVKYLKYILGQIWFIISISVPNLCLCIAEQYIYIFFCILLHPVTYVSNTKSVLQLTYGHAQEFQCSCFNQSQLVAITATTATTTTNINTTTTTTTTTDNNNNKT